METHNGEQEKLIFSKLTYIRDEYSKIEFNYEFLIHEAMHHKTIYEKCNIPINYDNISTNFTEYMIEYQEKKIKSIVNIKEFIEVKLYSFEIQLQYFLRCLTNIKDDYKELNNFILKDNHYNFITFYSEKFQELNKQFYDRIAQIDLHRLQKDLSPKYSRSILPHKQIDNYFLDNIKNLERLNLIKLNYQQKYLSLLFPENNQIEKYEEYQLKKNEFMTDVTKIIEKIDTFFEIIKKCYLNGTFRVKININTDVFPILFILKKNIKLKQEFVSLM
jgi:hypothetical protein